MILKLKSNGVYTYKESKKFNSFTDENGVVYIEKQTDISNYQILKKISEVANDSENLHGITAFYQDQTNPKILKYLVELKNVKTLSDIIDSGVKLNSEEIDSIIYQIASGLKVLHDNQILHRDIKPDNIIIDEHNLIQLIDYDISRIYKPDQEQDTTTSGTRGFIAPELYVNLQTDIRSDIFSFGKTIEKVVMSCASQPVIYGELIARCCQMNPDDRYQNADSIIEVIIKKKNRFFPAQLEQITKGQELGLSDEEINLYARYCYNAKQMGVIKHAIHEQIDDRVLSLICDEELSSRQMWQIKTAAKNGVKYQDILKFAKAHYDVNEMTVFRLGLEQNLSTAKIKVNIREFNELLINNTFSNEQLVKLRQGLYLGLDIERIKVYAHDFLSIEQMQKILSILCEDEK